MSKYTREELRDMARKYVNSDDYMKKMSLMMTMQMITGMRQDQVEQKIQELSK